MKILFLLSVLLVFVSTQKVKCPKKGGRVSVLLSDPDNCSRFYVCSNGTSWRLDCPIGLDYNVELRVCDWPETAGCRVKCPPKDGAMAVLLPDPFSCSGFFVCSNGTPFRQTCPAGLQFNNNLKICDHPEGAGCEERRYQEEEVGEDETTENENVTKTLETDAQFIL